MLRVTGYVDRWSARPGERLVFYVSSEDPTYRVELRRLVQCDARPQAPGVKEEIIDHPLNSQLFSGAAQRIETGSCMTVASAPALARFTVTAAFQPTLLADEGRGLLAFATASGQSYAVVVDGQGAILRSNDGELARSSRPLEAGRWYDLLLTVDLSRGTFDLSVRPARFHPADGGARLRATLAPSPDDLLGSLVIGASGCVAVGRRRSITAPFNGRVADVSLFDGAPTMAIEDWHARRPVSAVPVAAWRFAEEAGGEVVPDGASRRFDGRTVNRPTRLVAGPRYEGQVQRATEAPELFNAIHFHDDDLDDAGWDPAFAFDVPDDLRSGVYAFRLTAGDSVDYIPFFVTPAPGAEVLPVGVLISTLSYQIYANLYAELDQLPPSEAPLRNLTLPETPEEAYVRVHRLRSCYDVHADGSGVCMASMLRPMPIFARPRSLGRLNNSEHLLGADLYLIDWLEAKRIPYALVTDHELHAGGVDALKRFRTVITGTHAEYWTAAMLDGLKSYTDAGGRFICLSGNGLYWATALGEDGTVAEVRRDHGLRSWTARSGEAQLSLDGSMGGVWRNLGRPPNLYTGVGFTSMGFDNGRPYTRSDASRTSRAAFLFDGIEEEEIGDFPSLISGYGAAGAEFDRADGAQGTPAHALVLATASGFSDVYQLTVDEVVTTHRYFGGATHPDVRADIVFYETPKGGAVFSAASISWCGGLSYNDYRNSVSRLTENVVRCFMQERLPHAISGAPATSGAS